MVSSMQWKGAAGEPFRSDHPGKHRHIPSKITTPRGQRDCVLCKREGRFTGSYQSVQTSFECLECAVALCKNRGCFQRFHCEWYMKLGIVDKLYIGFGTREIASAWLRVRALQWLKRYIWNLGTLCACVGRSVLFLLLLCYPHPFGFFFVFQNVWMFGRF